MNSIAATSSVPESVPVTIDPEELNTEAGCGAVLARINRRRVFVNERMMAARDDDARAFWRDEMAALDRTRGLVKEMRSAIGLSINQTYEKGFMLAAKRRLAPHVLAQLHEDARAYVDGLEERRRIVSTSVGAAIGMHGGSPGPKQRP